MSSLAYLVCSIAVFYLDHVLILSFLMFFGHPVALASRQETMTFFFKASLANSAVTIAHSWEGFKKIWNICFSDLARLLQCLS